MEQKIIYVPISEIKPYGKNPRKIDKAVDVVARSISEFGFRVPIVIDRNNVIVCGHVRFKAAQRLKLDALPCIVADDLTQEQITAFRIIDNKTQELSTWDFGKLLDELDDLIGQVDMAQFGFNDKKPRDGASDREQNIDDSEEIDLDEFGDEQFTCTCPSCGFRFND